MSIMTRIAWAGVILLIFTCAILGSLLDRAYASSWCAWTDWSAHSQDKCAKTRAECEKKKQGGCTEWFGP